MSTKRALIIGITGQHGTHMPKVLQAKGYEVHDIRRGASSIKSERIDHLYQDPHERRLLLHYGMRQLTIGSADVRRAPKLSARIHIRARELMDPIR